MSETRAAIAGVLTCIAILIGFAFVPSPVSASLLMGWLSFAMSVLPQIQVRAGGVAVFAVSFAFAVACSHYLLRWLVSEYNTKRQADTQIRWRLRSTVSLVLLCMMIFVVGIAMAGVTHQVGWLVTSPDPMFASKTQSQRDSELSTYRPHTDSSDTGQSWLFRCLTYFFYIAPEIDPSKPWNAPENADAFRTVPWELNCPSQGNPVWSPDGFGLSHVAGNPDVFKHDSKLTFKDFDSVGQTAFAGEVNAAFVPWGDLSGLRSTQLGVNDDWTGSRRGEVGYGSQHPSGTMMLMGDGSVRFVDYHIDPEVLKQLGRRRK